MPIFAGNSKPSALDEGIRKSRLSSAMKIQPKIEHKRTLRLGERPELLSSSAVSHSHVSLTRPFKNLISQPP